MSKPKGAETTPVDQPAREEGGDAAASRNEQKLTGRLDVMQACIRLKQGGNVSTGKR